MASSRDVEQPLLNRVSSNPSEALKLGGDVSLAFEGDSLIVKGIYGRPHLTFVPFLSLPT